MKKISSFLFLSFLSPAESEEDRIERRRRKWVLHQMEPARMKPASGKKRALQKQNVYQSSILLNSKQMSLYQMSSIQTYLVSSSLYETGGSPCCIATFNIFSAVSHLGNRRKIEINIFIICLSV
jgi:hypothetical protein